MSRTPGATSTVRRALRRVGARGPTNEHSGPVVLFAGVLDGRHLWLAVDPADAPDPRLGLRWADGRVVELPCVTEAEPGPTAGTGIVVHCRVPLADLPAPEAEAAVARVVLLTAAGEVEPRAPDGVLDQRVRRPSSMPAGLRGDLRPGVDGALGLVLSRAHGLAHLQRTAVEDGALRLVVATDTPADALVLLDDDGDVVATLDVDTVPGGFACVVDPEAAATATAPLVVAASVAGRPVPVRRAWDDLDAPDAAVALPAVATADDRILRLAWQSGGVLSLLAPVDAARNGEVR